MVEKITRYSEDCGPGQCGTTIEDDDGDLINRDRLIEVIKKLRDDIGDCDSGEEARGIIQTYNDLLELLGE